MAQQASGHAITQIAVEASQNVNITINGQLALELRLPAYPLPLPESRQEIDLLKAAHAQIPFVGRQTILQDFKDWCADPRSLSMRVLVGQGGAGKTRFAYELYATFRQQPQWAAYFLGFLKDEAKEVDLWVEIKSQNALIIVDYASDVARPLADVLRRLAESAPEGRRIRVLLVARTASWEQGWLAGLASGRTGEDVDRHFHPREPNELPQFAPKERQAIFQKTLTLAAEYIGKPAPPPPPLAAFTGTEVGERLADPLTLMMAALVALESGSTSALSLSRPRLAFAVAQKLVADRMKVTVDDRRELFLHMAAYATLCCGLQEEEALQVLQEESKHTHLGNVADPKAFLNKLQAWLPGEKTKTWLGVIEPDIVGEAFVLGEENRVYLRQPENAALRAARHRPAPAIQTLVRMAQDFSFSVMEPRSEPIAWLTRLVAKGEADDDLLLLFDLSGALPESSVVLREVSLHIDTALCTRLRKLIEHHDAEIPLGMRALFAASLNNLANRQSEAGQQEAARATAEEAVRLRRELAGRNRDAFLPDLAMSLNNLANRQSEAGQWEAALATAGEAVRLCRELAADRQDRRRPRSPEREELWEQIKVKLGHAATDKIEAQPDDPTQWELFKAKLLVALDEDPAFQEKIRGLAQHVISQQATGSGNTQVAVSNSKDVNISVK